MSNVLCIKPESGNKKTGTKALFNHDIFNQPKRKERLNVESKIGTMKINQTHIKKRKGKLNKCWQK